MMMSMTATDATFDCVLGLQSPHQAPKHHRQYRCDKEEKYLTIKLLLFNK